MQVWKSHQQRFFDERQEDDLHLGGDCRCDSPGFSAKYGSYSLMDMECSKVLDMQLVQVSTAYLRTKLFHLQIVLNQCVNQIDKGKKRSFIRFLVQRGHQFKRDGVGRSQTLFEQLGGQRSECHQLDN